MEEHTIVMNSWRTSNSTQTLSEFRSLGINDGYKYVPKAHEIKPPFLKKVKLPSKNMNLSIITDSQLFTKFHKLDLMDGDCAAEQLESLLVEEEEEIMSTECSDILTDTEDTSWEDISDIDSACDSMDCSPDIQPQEYFPQVKLYSPQEYTRDVQSSSLDTDTEDVSMADLSQKSNSDCDSMDCNPDIHAEECYPQVKMNTPQEYITFEHNYSLNDYNA